MVAAHQTPFAGWQPHFREAKKPLLGGIKAICTQMGLSTAIEMLQVCLVKGGTSDKAGRDGGPELSQHTL